MKLTAEKQKHKQVLVLQSYVENKNVYFHIFKAKVTFISILWREVITLS